VHGSKATRCAAKAAGSPWISLEQDGEDGFNVSFPVEYFKQVVEIMQARTRRIMTEEQRQKAAEILRPYQIQPRTTASK